MYNMLSVDGYFAATDGNLDWHVVDEEFDRYAASTMPEFDTVLLGRVTYELFAGFWPQAPEDPGLSAENLTIAHALNSWRKIVFSRTMSRAEWEHSEVVHDVNRDHLQALKEQNGRDIALYGSGAIVRELTRLRLIDEYRFMVNPVILGDGQQLFTGLPPLPLTLVEQRTFGSGNTLFRYTPA